MTKSIPIISPYKYHSPWLSDEEEVTYPIDDVLAALAHAENMTLEQVEARIEEIAPHEEPLPLEIAEFGKLQLAAMYFRKFNLESPEVIVNRCPPSPHKRRKRRKFSRSCSPSVR